VFTSSILVFTPEINEIIKGIPVPTIHFVSLVMTPA